MVIWQRCNAMLRRSQNYTAASNVFQKQQTRPAKAPEVLPYAYPSELAPYQTPPCLFTSVNTIDSSVELNTDQNSEASISECQFRNDVDCGQTRRRASATSVKAAHVSNIEADVTIISASLYETTNRGYFVIPVINIWLRHCEWVSD